MPAKPQGPAEIRKANLKKILENRFRGRIADMARALDRDDAYLWQLLNGDRNAGERIARHIESKLALPLGALDTEPGATTEAHPGLSAKEEMVLHLFAGLFSHQQRETIDEMHALFQANQITRKELGQKPLRGVSNGQIEASFGAAPPPSSKKRPKPLRGETGTHVDDSRGEPE